MLQAYYKFVVLHSFLQTERKLYAEVGSLYKCACMYAAACPVLYDALFHCG